MTISQGFNYLSYVSFGNSDFLLTHTIEKSNILLIIFKNGNIFFIELCQYLLHLFDRLCFVL